MTGGSGSGNGDILISKIDWVPTSLECVRQSFIFL